MQELFRCPPAGWMSAFFQILELAVVTGTRRGQYSLRVTELLQRASPQGETNAHRTDAVQGVQCSPPLCETWGLAAHDAPRGHSGPRASPHWMMWFRHRAHVSSSSALSLSGPFWNCRRLTLWEVFFFGTCTGRCGDHTLLTSLVIPKQALARGVLRWHVSSVNNNREKATPQGPRSHD